ncbi:HAD-IB family hydrolase [Myxococcus stipitatus]|uniref:HAD family hydrolase n=1 Tax=Myxococcus stipitatus TaxID=83455 RepID=UPI001F1BF563|nr:HAD family hydrolase [Myxococcus stipitatus]MCE9666884.1 HAD-IB family hydrolase [Myxococcus stipitatus]
MAVAFFDLDRTLISANSGALWLRRELALGHITRFQALGASLWLARYHLGFVSMQAAVARVISRLAGAPVAPLQRRMEAFYDETVRALYRPGAWRALAAHRRAGDRLVLLTSSTDSLSRLVARDLDLDAVLCNRFEVDAEGRHTGRPLGVICFGEGKRTLAREYADRVGAALSACAFYTDSYSDLPLLEVVGRPVVVHPDHRLRRVARRRGWPVVHWDEPTGGSAMAAPPVVPTSGP